MMKRRSKLEIYLDVLKAVSETGRLTHIGNLANLSCWKDTMKHLEFLELKGFVKAMKNSNGKNEYTLTQKGVEALEAFRQLIKTLSPKLEQMG